MNILIYSLLVLSTCAMAFGVYVDNVARNKMMPMAAAAYSDSPNLCIESIFPNASVCFLTALKDPKICYK